MNAAVPPEQVHSCGWGTEGCPCLRSTAIRQTDVLPRRRSVPGRARIRLHRSRSRDLYWRYQAEKEEKRREEREEERRERGEEKRELLNRWRGMKNEEHCQGSFFLCRIRECVLNYLFQLQHPGFQHYLQSSGRRDRRQSQTPTEKKKSLQSLSWKLVWKEKSSMKSRGPDSPMSRSLLQSSVPRACLMGSAAENPAHSAHVCVRTCFLSWLPL
ncbi:putative uncharacterized protein LINC02901 isoform X5 [Symphalangus syndactylus]|uniref:putative uncharacterized protein LINC02901 isoform X5 n=1 Tax=Symphalangus syndactylus TaxID=9590 RepID=UPI003004CAFC